MIMSGENCPGQGHMCLSLLSLELRGGVLLNVQRFSYILSCSRLQYICFVHSNRYVHLLRFLRRIIHLLRPPITCRRSQAKGKVESPFIFADKSLLERGA